MWKNVRKLQVAGGWFFLIHTVLCDPVLAVWPSLFIWDHLLKCLFFQSVYLSCSAAGRSQPFLYTEFPLWRDMFSEFEGEMSYFRSHTRKDWSGHTTAEVWSYETFMIVLRPRSRSLFLSTCFLSSSVVRQVKHFCRNALTYRYMQLTGIWRMFFPKFVSAWRSLIWITLMSPHFSLSHRATDGLRRLKKSLSHVLVCTCCGERPRWSALKQAVQPSIWQQTITWWMESMSSSILAPYCHPLVDVTQIYQDKWVSLHPSRESGPVGCVTYIVLVQM